MAGIINLLNREEPEKRIFLDFLRPSELRDYQTPEGTVLVGDNHITRGSVFVIGGAPGLGKSRSAVALAEAGATGYEWFGLQVQSKFRTLIRISVPNRAARRSHNTDLVPFSGASLSSPLARQEKEVQGSMGWVASLFCPRQTPVACLSSA